jgi:hypothetical protein
MTRVEDPTRRATVPRLGPKYVIQYFISSTSGSQRRMVRPADSQLSGFAESRIGMLGIGSASSSGVTYCVWPGKSAFGYWRVNV